MRMWSWIAAAFVILVLQTTSLGFFGGNLFFDLPLLFIYSIGLFYGARAGLLCGLAFGLLQDISSPVKNNYGYHVLIIGGLSLLLRVLYAIPFLWLNAFGTTALILYLQDSLWYCLGNMLLILPVSRILLTLYHWIAEEDVTY